MTLDQIVVPGWLGTHWPLLAVSFINLRLDLKMGQP